MFFVPLTSNNMNGRKFYASSGQMRHVTKRTANVRRAKPLWRLRTTTVAMYTQQ